MLDYNMKPFRFWCQKVLPLVYDDSLSYMELLCKVVNYLNHVIEDINGIPDYINQLISDDKLKEIMTELIDELREQVARANEGTNTTASYDRTKDELVWLNGKLVRMTRNILAGDRYIEDSGTQGITGNYVFTSVEMELTRVKESLANEITNRQTADALLQTNINNEASARQDADNALSGRIDVEISARESADNALGGRIDTEANTRQTADNQLQTNIDNANINISAIRTRVTEIENSIANIIYDIIVDINGNGDYTSLATAVSNASDGDRIYVCAGTYNDEVVNCLGKKLIIVGEDKNTTIIQNSYDDYYRPPLNIGKGLVSNLTIKQNGNTGTTPAYGIHIDNTDLYNNMLTFDNCNIYSHSTFGVGIGTRNNCELNFYNCEIKSDSGVTGALFVHPSGIVAESGNNQNMLLVDCILESTYTTVISCGKVGDSQNNTYVTCIGCLLFNDEIPRTGYITHRGDGTGDVYFKVGGGNNYEYLNHETWVPDVTLIVGRYGNLPIKKYFTSGNSNSTQSSFALPSDVSVILGYDATFTTPGAIHVKTGTHIGNDYANYYHAYCTNTTGYVVSSEECSYLFEVTYVSSNTDDI